MSEKLIWKIAQIIPNITLNKPFETDFIAIVPHNDERIKNITNLKPEIDKFINGFQNQFGKKRNISIMIFRHDIPDSLRENEAVVGIRNIYAISCIINAIENKIISLNTRYTLFSDYFNFYPISLSRDQECLITSSPAIRGLLEIEDFKFGETNSALPSSFIIPEPDELILSSLKKVWKLRYVSRKNRSWKTQVLFRSLEMAYQATSLPFENNSTIYDRGSRIALWVSAFEVLSHPENGKADLDTVFNLIDNKSLTDPRLYGRYYKILVKGKESRVSLIKKLYKELYDVRNDFLHGNKVTMNSLFHSKNSRRPDLLSLAPIIYKVALLHLLEILNIDILINKSLGDSFKNYFYIQNLQEALLSATRDSE